MQNAGLPDVDARELLVNHWPAPLKSVRRVYGSRLTAHGSQGSQLKGLTHASHTAHTAYTAYTPHMAQSSKLKAHGSG